MIEGRTRPGGGVVTLLAGLREARRDVIRIGRALEVFQVAGNAGRVRAGQVVVVIDVALRALHPGVRAGQREAGGRVIEGGAGPRRRAVALLAGLRESGTDVVGIRGALEVLQVTAHAGRVCAGEVVVSIHVALRALHAGVRAGQREPRGRVIEGGAGPRGRAVALLASLREAGLHMVRIRGALEIFQVAADAGRVCAGQVVVAIHVALRALHAGVRARQREAGRRVIKSRTHPGGGAVALRQVCGKPDCT